MYYDGSNWVNEKEDGVKWCEHHKSIEHGFDYFEDGNSIAKVVRPTHCCYCGTPRPAEKRKLADELMDKTVWTFRGIHSAPMWDTTAEAAVEKICEEIDALAERSVVVSGASYAIKQHLKETLL